MDLFVEKPISRSKLEGILDQLQGQLSMQSADCSPSTNPLEAFIGEHEPEPTMCCEPVLDYTVRLYPFYIAVFGAQRMAALCLYTTERRVHELCCCGVTLSQLLTCNVCAQVSSRDGSEQVAKRSLGASAMPAIQTDSPTKRRKTVASPS